MKTLRVRRHQFRRVPLLLVSLLAIAPLSTSAAAAAIERTQSTRIEFASPVTSRGSPSPNVRIINTAAGSCEPGSTVLAGVKGGVPVYRCATRTLGILDPCWALRSSATVLCMTLPWSSDVYRVRYTGHLPMGASGTLNLNFPWGVQLVSGTRCVFWEGAHDQVGAVSADYTCGPHLWLLGTPTRTNGYWTQPSAVREANGSLIRGATVRLRTGWFAA